MLTYYNLIKTLLISGHTALHIVVLPSHVSTVTCVTTLHILFNQYKFFMCVCMFGDTTVKVAPPATVRNCAQVTSSAHDHR